MEDGGRGRIRQRMPGTCPSDFFLELPACNVAVTEYLGKQTSPDGLTPVHGNHGTSSVRMRKEVMAALDANNIESKASQGPDKLRTLDGRKGAHAITATRCTPTN